MASYNKAFCEVAQKFKISCFNEHQINAILTFIKEGRDIFVNLPTGFGKSLIFQALPLILDSVFCEQNQQIRQDEDGQGHIVAVVSPLLNLIADQVKSLMDLGIKAVSLSEVQTEEDMQKIERGCFSVVYGTPEAWLKNQRWRDMLTNSTYSFKLCALAIDEAHVIKQWGTSTNNNLVAFRDCYSRLHEFRSLAPGVHMIALTATATKFTIETVFDVLLMDNPYIIFESPNKDNIAYVVKYMARDADLEQYFGWLVDELRTKKELCGRTIIYCQTIKQCGLLYTTLKAMLRNDMFVGDRGSNYCLIEMLHSCTPSANKEYIIKSFGEEQGVIRVLVATIAFGMGVNCQAVSRVIHFGPSKNIESYTQETGRAGRNGSQAVAYLLYNGLLLNHVDLDIKSYIKSDTCRRKTILEHFEENAITQCVLHFCCDCCAAKCQCGMPDCGIFTSYPSNVKKKEPDAHSRSRDITSEQRADVHEKLTSYHKLLISKLMSTAAKTEIKTLTNISLLLSFSDVQILQVLDNLHKLFSLSDICKLVEIWDMKHANKILSITKDVFKDIEYCPERNVDFSLGNDDDMDDTTLIDDWETLLDDDELFAMAIENLSVSQLEDTVAEQNQNISHASLNTSLPADVLETIQWI